MSLPLAEMWPVIDHAQDDPNEGHWRGHALLLAYCVEPRVPMHEALLIGCRFRDVRLTRQDAEHIVANWAVAAEEGPET